MARPKAVSSRPGFVIPAHYRVRRDRIDSSGKLTLRYNSRLHHIGLGRRHAGVRILVLVADLDVRILTQDGELLRELRLDPTRNYQPQRSSRWEGCPETRVHDVSGHHNSARAGRRQNPHVREFPLSWWFKCRGAGGRRSLHEGRVPNLSWLRVVSDLDRTRRSLCLCRASQSIRNVLEPVRVIEVRENVRAIRKQRQ